MRFTVSVTSSKYQTLFVPYEGVQQDEAYRIANVCIQAINAARGEALVRLTAKSKVHVWLCEDGQAVEAGPGTLPRKKAKV